ncbi:hypothetical protein EZS27_031048 [termite gut metagenome]|uniref:Uncharacterized protein n=1 Tax=termite gut metagenome TaxID=433724 RepID=A0A5J4QEK4_9ZZZZ
MLSNGTKYYFCIIKTVAMKRLSILYVSILVLFSLIFIQSCQTDNNPKQFAHARYQRRITNTILRGTQPSTFHSPVTYILHSTGIFPFGI